jgi:hypothetical protein
VKVQNNTRAILVSFSFAFFFRRGGVCFFVENPFLAHISNFLTLTHATNLLPIIIQGFGYTVTNRSASNQLYVPELDRNHPHTQFVLFYFVQIYLQIKQAFLIL